MKNTTRIAVGYIRVSTGEQAAEGASLADQRERIEGYAKAHGYRLELVEADEGLSGKRADNRPGLERALRAVCKAKGVLIVTNLVRLARSTTDAIDLAKRVEACGADLASIGEQLDTASPMGRFVFRLFASLGELEREQIAERTRVVMAHKRRQNERISRHIPVGFDLADDGVRLTKNAREQAAIERMRELRAEGLGYFTVAQRLTVEGFSAKRAVKWSAATVRLVLIRDDKLRAAA